MRTFIAIDLPERIKKEVISLKENIPSDCARIKWVKEENIHLTLLFLGEIIEDSLERIKDYCLVISKKHTRFLTSIQKSGAFPNVKRPRVIWVGVSEESKEQLVTLASDLRNALDFLKINDRKGFSPHITIGRVKSIYDLVSLGSGIESLSIKTEEFPVKEITLFKSVLKPDGPIYTPISQFPLLSTDR